MSTTIQPLEGITAQQNLIDTLENTQFGWEIIIGDAFVRGMRDIGYKSTAYALCELLDNSIQAGATHIDVIFGYDGGQKPTKLAVVDDGHGMLPKMVRASLVWGAGTRAQDRSGFGKYGYGLPTASVSQARRVTVYSKTAATDWTSAYLDVDEISEGKWTNGARIEMPLEAPAAPPQWVLDGLKAQNRDPLSSGTVVVWEKLDRIEPKLRDALRNRLVTDIGVIYRNFLLATPMTVDGVPVEPCDPLFLTEGFRYYDTDDDRAIAYPSSLVEVKEKGSDEVLGYMRVRYARFPASFFRKPELKKTNKPGRNSMNERLPVADAHNGIVFLRNGRQIDVARPPANYHFTINATTDRFWGVEVDFDATLDEYFSITTSKQQVVPDSRIWDVLRDKADIFKTVGQMRTEYEKEAKQIAANAEADKETKRASIAALEEAKKFRTTPAPVETTERKKEADDNFKREASKRAEQSGVPVDLVERELEASQKGNALAVETEDMPGAPFFRCEPRGGQRVLLLNVAHPFYTELYMGYGTNPYLRAGLELLLWTLGEAEVDADPKSDRRRFYESKRGSVWSPYLAQALTSLSRIEIVTDQTEQDEAA